MTEKITKKRLKRFTWSEGDIMFEKRAKIKIIGAKKG